MARTAKAFGLVFVGILGLLALAGLSSCAGEWPEAGQYDFRVLQGADGGQPGAVEACTDMDDVKLGDLSGGVTIYERGGELGGTWDLCRGLIDGVIEGRFVQGRPEPKLFVAGNGVIVALRDCEIDAVQTWRCTMHGAGFNGSPAVLERQHGIGKLAPICQPSVRDCP